MLTVIYFIWQFDHEFQDDATLKSNLECVPGGSTNCLAENGMKVSYDRGSIILLLRNELESALDNLEAVQAEKVRLLNDKEEQKRTEIQNRARIDCFSAEVIRLMSEITDKEKFFGTRMMQLESKLEIVEKNVVAFKECWHRTKEVRFFRDAFWTYTTIYGLKSVSYQCYISPITLPCYMITVSVAFS